MNRRSGILLPNRSRKLHSALLSKSGDVFAGETKIPRSAGQGKPAVPRWRPPSLKGGGEWPTVLTPKSAGLTVHFGPQLSRFTYLHRLLPRDAANWEKGNKICTGFLTEFHEELERSTFSHPVAYLNTLLGIQTATLADRSGKDCETLDWNTCRE